MFIRHTNTTFLYKANRAHNAKMGYFGGKSTFLNITPNHVIPPFKGLGKIKRSAQTRSLYLNHFQNGGL